MVQKHKKCIFQPPQYTQNLPDIDWRSKPSGRHQTLTVELSAVTANSDRRQTAVTGQECPDRVTLALVELLEIDLTDQSLALLSSDPERI